jgi:hypothetical protein
MAAQSGVHESADLRVVARSCHGLIGRYKEYQIQYFITAILHAKKWVLCAVVAMELLLQVHPKLSASVVYNDLCITSEAQARGDRIVGKNATNAIHGLIDIDGNDVGLWD